MLNPNLQLNENNNKMTIFGKLYFVFTLFVFLLFPIFSVIQNFYISKAYPNDEGAGWIIIGLMLYWILLIFPAWGLSSIVMFIRSFQKTNYPKWFIYFCRVCLVFFILIILGLVYYLYL